MGDSRLFISYRTGFTSYLFYLHYLQILYNYYKQNPKTMKRQTNTLENTNTYKGLHQ